MRLRSLATATGRILLNVKKYSILIWYKIVNFPLNFKFHQSQPRHERVKDF